MNMLINYKKIKTKFIMYYLQTESLQ